MTRITTLLCALLLSTVAFAQNITGTWTGMLQAGTVKLHVVFNLTQDANGKETCTMDSPDQSVKGIPAQILYIDSDSLSLSVPAAGISYTGRRREGIIRGTFMQGGQTFPLDLRAEVLAFRRPQHPVPPYPYETKEVTFDNPEAEATLAGTLTYPVGYQAGQPVPVVLLVTGSGPENRDEEIFEHKPFLVIADHLARHGIASLRYDDRKVGQSTGKRPTINTVEVADDAMKGVEYLRSLKLFSSIGMLGHSEGANVVFILGAKHAIDFGISMAGVGVLGGDALYAQARAIAEAAGQQYPFDKAKYLEIISQQHNPWLDYFVAYNPVEDIKQTTCPVFALNGTNDLQVLADLNLTSIKQHLSANAKHQVKSYPGLNHLFQHCTTGMPTEYTQIEETISPEVLNDIVKWIKAL